MSSPPNVTYLKKVAYKGAYYDPEPMLAQDIDLHAYYSNFSEMYKSFSNQEKVIFSTLYCLHRLTGHVEKNLVEHLNKQRIALGAVNDSISALMKGLEFISGHVDKIQQRVTALEKQKGGKKKSSHSQKRKSKH